MPAGFASFMGSAGGQAAIQGGFSVGGNLFSAREAKKQNKRNVAMNRENRDWMERMSNTEWTRGVADMLNAGINPMLAVSQGGASTPSNQAPEVQKEEKWSRVAESVSKNPATMLAMQQLAANVKLTNANAYKVEKEGDQAAFNTFPEVMGKRFDMEMKMLEQQLDNEKAKGALTTAQEEQIRELLPATVQLEIARRRLTDEQSTSAAQTRRLEGYTEAELRATQRWFEEMGASGKVMEFLNKAIMMLGRK